MDVRYDSGEVVLVCRNRHDDRCLFYRLDPHADDPFIPLHETGGASFDRHWRMARVGGYLLQWGPLGERDGVSGYPYALREFDPSLANPLLGPLVQGGFWEQNKFLGHRTHYGDDPDEGQQLDLVPVGSFVLCLIPTRGRGTFELWNFDPRPDAPGSEDPIPEPYSAQGEFTRGQGAFPLIRKGHTLLPMGDYVLERLPGGRRFHLWSFDPQLDNPLSLPVIREGSWNEIDDGHELTVVGNQLLDWCPGHGRYRLWTLDPNLEELLAGPVREGRLPAAMGPDSELVAFEASPRIDSGKAVIPGTMDFMRSRIRHVVYYMLESRSFDNVCGWLYENGGRDCHFIGRTDPFDGATTEDFNWHGDRKVHVSQFHDGVLSEEWDLDTPGQDPFHHTSDSLQQMFSDISGYWRGEPPDMQGFILNTADDQVMQTLSPEQLPVLNGLARHFAVSDEWFSSIPGGTDVNRAFSLTGSAFNRLGTWEGGNAYQYWPCYPRRQSIWKLLWSHGITDWKIYNAVLWQDAVFTRQLFLRGQVPSLDAEPSRYLADIEQFKTDARRGELPAFSYLEPAWIAPSGSTSYHPGSDLVPAERTLNEIYEALRDGPAWENTLLVITFDKNGGTYDHVSPPYACKPWPNDGVDGFRYDLMGPRVPAIMVSPWIRERSVIRSGGTVPFDSTSFGATLLQWFGVPRCSWCLGDRMVHAPSFESVLQADEPRQDGPSFTPPYDQSNPRSPHR
ncbi:MULTISPECIES: alkaline phosphatase family protein [unclassified Thioalkalivibrio]|uniref:alkaline phosphatase family protein n=1 Tax=unclassified Thioalkalivibrio TaxID=2621013 RepID=UPI000366418D|nr:MULTISPECIES: alkaline phosphatase family protein [unclassified Thioalkalivibrio]